MPVRAMPAALRVGVSHRRGLSKKGSDDRGQVGLLRGNGEELDPSYADAYRSLTLSYFVGYLWQFDKDPGVLDHAAKLVEKASLFR